MMFFTMLFIINLIKNIKKTSLILSNNEFIFAEKKNDKNYNITGIDGRFNNTINENDTYRLLLLHRKKQLLDLLEDDKVSIFQKIEIVKDNSIQPFNLFAGGLFADFDSQ